MEETDSQTYILNNKPSSKQTDRQANSSTLPQGPTTPRFNLTSSKLPQSNPHPSNLLQFHLPLLSNHPLMNHHHPFTINTIQSVPIHSHPLSLPKPGNIPSRPNRPIGSTSQFTHNNRMIHSHNTLRSFVWGVYHTGRMHH
jgi:hypothetical protein